MGTLTSVDRLHDWSSLAQLKLPPGQQGNVLLLRIELASERMLLQAGTGSFAANLVTGQHLYVVLMLFVLSSGERGTGCHLSATEQLCGAVISRTACRHSTVSCALDQFLRTSLVGNLRETSTQLT